MKTPQFWSTRGTLAKLLLPISILYDIVSTMKRAQVKPNGFPVPVICVGNLIAGGSGKTPVALYIGRMLKSKNVNAFYVSRGYGGKFKGPVLVNPKKHSAREAGDEPLLLSEVLPTVVSKDRVAGVRYALSKGAKAIVLDDGLQNPSVVKSLALLVIDGQNVFGNGYLIPAGPLRERPENGYKRAHAIIVLNRSTRVPPLPSDRPALNARTFPQNAEAFKGRKVIAFCGIAYPDKFFATLSSAGAQLVEKIPFADHYPYSMMDMQKLLFKGHIADAVLVTTAKDAVRIPAKYRDCVAVLDIGIEFENPAMMENIIDYIMNPPQNTPENT